MLRRVTYVLTGLLLAVLLPHTAEAQKEEIRREAQQVLSDRYPDAAGHTKVRVRRVRGGVDSTAEMRLQFSQRGRRPEGLTQVDVLTERESGAWEESGWALLRVSRFDSVATVRGRLKAGDAVTPADISSAWMNVTDFRGEPMRLSAFREQGADGKMVATRHLSSGRALREGDVRPPYAVDTGTAVKMHYRNGRVAFRIACETREPGFLDERVRVRCPDTNTMYSARVVTEKLVQWVETL